MASYMQFLAADPARLDTRFVARPAPHNAASAASTAPLAVSIYFVSAACPRALSSHSCPYTRSPHAAGGYSTTVPGYPRVGSRRPYKTLLEKFWSGATTLEEFDRGVTAHREERLRMQATLGLDIIPSGDFSLYDHVLDIALMFGCQPARFEGLQVRAVRLPAGAFQGNECSCESHSTATVGSRGADAVATRLLSSVATRSLSFCSPPLTTAAGARCLLRRRPRPQRRAAAGDD
jgi:hypothetical protein